jgi:hypothetical protein
MLAIFVDLNVLEHAMRVIKGYLAKVGAQKQAGPAPFSE